MPRCNVPLAIATTVRVPGHPKPLPVGGIRQRWRHIAGRMVGYRLRLTYFPALRVDGGKVDVLCARPLVVLERNRKALTVRRCDYGGTTTVAVLARQDSDGFADGLSVAREDSRALFMAGRNSEMSNPTTKPNSTMYSRPETSRRKAKLLRECVSAFISVPPLR